MVSLEDGKSTKRLAIFLKPCFGSINQSSGVPNIPTISQIFSHKNQDWHPNLNFKGWKNPQKKWFEWVNHMAGDNALMWNQTGICDAILSSLCRIACNQDLILGLVEYWCPETNTFIFPWGEATITHRVAMQFGLDQDLSGDFLLCSQIAWKILAFVFLINIISLVCP
ncbi:hypothetical protein L6164_029385 [Bauhinia variegata]|uniref:Uncharacterized protein n=1 Tax=Bauhinia variegata TaxID=167791 RepID=A0ACB9L9H5_BAUVA|nr:hypothetical protein L6164_029385 [Bauhinia variegata]